MGILTWCEYISLNDHGKLVTKSNQNPVVEMRYWKATLRMSSQYVSEISKVPVKNWQKTSNCCSGEKFANSNISEKKCKELELGQWQSYHEEDINNNIEIECGKHFACISVVPQEYLYWHDHGSVKQQQATCEKHSWHPTFTDISDHQESLFSCTKKISIFF